MNAVTDGNAYLNPKNLATNLFANEDSNESETNKENEQASNQRLTFTPILCLLIRAPKLFSQFFLED